MPKESVHTIECLIDWDFAGIGASILDLGNLLLTTHYDLTQPLLVTADADKIQAILCGYQRARQITRADVELIASAIQFPLAFQVASYVENHEHINTDLILCQKARARFEATSEIARLARAYLA